LSLSYFGIALGLMLSFRPRRPSPLTQDHAPLGWPAWWRTAWFLALAAIVLASSFTFGPGWTIAPQERWRGSVHPFTWGAGIAAMRQNRG
jgi:hypothetical protein